MANLMVAVPYIKKAEGGLSRASTDTASKNPAPYVYKGLTGWHTSNGVTWTTFKSLGKTLGYEVNATNFFSMPDSIWLKIYEYGYFKPILAHHIQSDVIGMTIADYAWAFGVGGAKSRLLRWLTAEFKAKVTTMSQAVQFINSQNEATFFKKLLQHRKDAFLRLNQPKNNKGWLSRMDELEKFALELLKKKQVENPLT